MKVDIYSSDNIPLSRAFLWIFLCTLMISGLAWMIWLYSLNIKEMRAQDPQYRIIAIIQSSPHKEGLKTGYLAELLGLSVDQPINLYQFDLQEGVRCLLNSPLIKEAIIKKISPGTLYIDYKMRIPVAYIGDYSNMAIDREGYLFPFKPFFTPKKIPTIYLGLEDVEKQWGQTIGDNERLLLAFQVLDTLKEIDDEEHFFIKQIDVSQAFADSYGQQQVVVSLEDQVDYRKDDKVISTIHPYYLRLNTEKYKRNLTNFITLRKRLSEDLHLKIDAKPSTIDLRISHLAFIKSEIDSK